MFFTLMFQSISNGFDSYFKHKIISRIISIMIICWSFYFVVLGLYTTKYDISLFGLISFFGMHICIFYFFGTIKTINDFSRRQRYIKLFEKLGFKSLDDQLPIIINEEETEFMRLLTFRSQIPLSLWLKKKEVIETYLNVNISEISNDEDDNNIIYINIAKKSLPDNIAWDTSAGLGMGGKADILVLGKSYEGFVTFDLNQSAHAFIAGETGGGKSNILKGVIYQSLFLGYDVKLIDFKRGVSFSMFDGLVDIVYEHDEVKKLLNDLVEITNKRYDAFRNARVDTITKYNNLHKEQFKRIVVVIDELAELIQSGDKETTKSIIASLESLTRLSRAACINLVMGIQRPDSTIINGQIKSNVPFRVCGRFVDKGPSNIMLDNNMATTLPNIKGRFIVRNDGCTVFQAFRFDEDTMDMIALIELHDWDNVKQEPTREYNTSPEPSKTPPEPPRGSQRATEPSPSFKVPERPPRPPEATVQNPPVRIPPKPTQAPVQKGEISFNFDDIEI